MKSSLTLTDPFPTTPEKIANWENTVAFFAQLDASTNDSQLDFTNTWALTYITLGLVDPNPQFDHDSTLRMACSWFLYDAEKMWQKVPDDKNYPLTKWQSWKTALQEKQATVEDERTRNMVGAALAEIERVENL